MKNFWRPTKIFLLEVIVFYAAFFVVVLFGVLRTALQGAKHFDPSYFHSTLMLKVFPPILIGVGSFFGNFLAKKQNPPEKKSLLYGSLAFLFLNTVVMFWPSRNETYMTFLEGAVLSTALVLLLQVNFNASIKRRQAKIILEENFKI